MIAIAGVEIRLTKLVPSNQIIVIRGKNFYIGSSYNPDFVAFVRSQEEVVELINNPKELIDTVTKMGNL